MLRVIAIVLLSITVWAAELKIAHEDEAEWPWVTAKQDGLDQVLVKRAAEKAGVAIVFQSLPRKRAFEQLKTGELDGIINLSFKAERLELLAFPMAGDKADPVRGLHIDSNAVFARIGDPLAWDGKGFTGVTGAIGALPGHGSVDSLKALGVKVDDATKTMEGQLEKVLRGRIQAAVLPAEAGRLILERNAELGKGVAALPTPYATKASYLAFSKPFAAKSGDVAERMWKAIAEIRDTAEFKTLTKEFMGKGE